MTKNYCPSCGVKVNDSTIYCSNCGEQLISTQSSQEILEKTKEKVLNTSSKSYTANSKSYNSKPKYFSFAILILLLIAILTNPNEDRHKETIKSELNSYMQKNITKTDNEWEQAGQAIGIALGTTLINGIIENLVSTDNYILFSLTKITFQGKVKIIGIGIFGNVYLTNNLDEALHRGLIQNNNGNHRVD